MISLSNINQLKESLNDSPKSTVKVKRKRSEQELIEAAQAKDQKMDRSRKTPTKEEKQQQLLENMLNYQEQVEEPVVVKKTDQEWDVKIGDVVEFFDPTLSYEHTGYRPLTETEGLDFDPKVFTQAADHYRKYGSYSGMLPGTFSWDAYWEQEFNRCLKGYTVGKYRLTGENYFFLNFYRLLSPLAQGEEARSEDFPGFMAKQYEYFHYIELARKLKLDVLVFKCRGIKFCPPLK